MPERAAWVPGDLATWVHEPRGGYCQPMLVPVEVVRVSEKRVLVRAEKRSGGSKEIWITPERLRPRRTT